MALTTSSRFTSIILGWTVDYPWIPQLECLTDEAAPQKITVATDDPEVLQGGSVYSDLQVIRDIYASDAGFQNADGDSITPMVAGTPRGTITLDRYIEMGYPNPLSVDDINRWKNNLDVLADQRTTTRSKNTDGSIDHKSPLGLRQKPYTPTAQTVPLDWEVSPATTQRYSTILHEFSRSDGVTADNLQANLQVIGLHDRLVELHQAGEDPGDELTLADLGATTDAMDNPVARNYRITAGSNTVNFTVENVSSGVFLNSDGTASNIIQWIYVLIRHATGETFVAGDIEDALQPTPVDIDPQADSEYRQIGDIRAPLACRKIILPDGRELQSWDDHLRFKTGDGVLCPVTANNSKIQHISDLVAAIGNDGNGNAFPANSYWLPSDQVSGHVHFLDEVAANVVLYVNSPDRMTPRGNDYHLRVTNFSQLYRTITVRTSWDGHTLAVLRPTETCDLYISHEADGTGEVVCRMEDRVLLTSRDGSGLVTFNNFQQPISSLPRRRILPFGAIQARSVESYTTPINIPGLTGNIAGVWRQEGAGKFHLRAEIEIEITGSPGNNEQWVSPRIGFAYWLPGGGSGVNRLHTLPGLRTNGESTDFVYQRIIENEAQWRCALIFEDTGHMQLSAMTLNKYEVTISTNPTIVRTWSP